MTKTTETRIRYAVQSHHLGGQVGNQSWFWTDVDHRNTQAELADAQAIKAQYEERLAANPSKFTDGYRIVRREITTIEEVIG